MNYVDWIIVGLVVLMAIWGYRQGFIVGALSLAGFIGGAVLGSRLAAALLPGGSESVYAPIFSLLGALTVGSLVAAILEGIGARIRRIVAGGLLTPLDGLAGALLASALALGIAWIAGAVMLQTPVARDLRHSVQQSKILTKVNRLLPPSGSMLRLLARFDPFPSIAGPSPNVAPPDRAVLRRPSVRAAAESVVRILGTACGLGIEGSGWVAAPGVVVTNAHVVAGETDTTVQPGGAGPLLDAQATRFDARNDIAILSVPGLGLRALPYEPEADPGGEAAILGYPENGPFSAAAARVGQTATVISRDAYGRGPVERRMVAIRGPVRHGDSGGPVVDGSGRVVATVFAARESSPPSGFGVPGSVVRLALRRASNPVSTGACVPG